MAAKNRDASIKRTMKNGDKKAMDGKPVERAFKCGVRTPTSECAGQVATKIQVFRPIMDIIKHVILRNEANLGEGLFLW